MLTGSLYAQGPFVLSVQAFAISFPLLFPTGFIHSLENILVWKVKNMPKHLKKSHFAVFQTVPHTPQFQHKACVLPPSNPLCRLHVYEGKPHRERAYHLNSGWPLWGSPGLGQVQLTSETPPQCRQTQKQSTLLTAAGVGMQVQCHSRCF